MIFVHFHKGHAIGLSRLLTQKIPCFRSCPTDVYKYVLFVYHTYLQKCVLMFVLGTKNSSVHAQTNFLFGKVPNILKKFPTFCVDVIRSPLSSYGVATLFPLPGSFTKTKISSKLRNIFKFGLDHIKCPKIYNKKNQI